MGNAIRLFTAEKVRMLMLLSAVSVLGLYKKLRIDIQIDTFSTSKVISIPDYCLQHRGSNGNWYLNETFGREAFYLMGYRANKWWKTKGKHNGSAVYGGNKYAWNDSTSTIRNEKGDSPFNHQCAPIQALKLDSFCDTMRRLGIRRILFVGDSLTLGHYESLFGLLHVGKKALAPEGMVGCSSSSQNSSFFIQVIFRRESLGPNLFLTNVTERAGPTDRQQFGPETEGCGGPMVDGYCSWHKMYNATPATRQKTLLILNQGAHFHSIGSFTRSMDQFVDLYHSIAHPDDLLFFRSAVPGHKGCFDHKNVSIPEMTHDKFLELHATNDYDWNLFDEYNTIAKQKLEQIRLVNGMQHVYYLNVYNMTVLRRDAHVSAKDCLHYMSVGPIDYWNHLLFTNLADLAVTVEEK